MKKKKKSHKPSGESQTRRVHIEFTHPSAATINLAGSFNDWRPEATQMIELGDGRWVKEVMLPPGTYEYCLVVDGQWMPDPSVRETVPNPFGGQNSVLNVKACE